MSDSIVKSGLRLIVSIYYKFEDKLFWFFDRNIFDILKEFKKIMILIFVRKWKIIFF